MTGCGTQGSGLVDKVVLGQRFDSMILEVFSNLNDSMILSSGNSGNISLEIRAKYLFSVFQCVLDYRCIHRLFSMV